MQNPNPRTRAQLEAILDERNRKHGVKPLAGVLPDLSAPQIRSRQAEDACTGFSARRFAIGIVEQCNED